MIRLSHKNEDIEVTERAMAWLLDSLSWPETFLREMFCMQGMSNETIDVVVLQAKKWEGKNAKR